VVTNSHSGEQYLTCPTTVGGDGDGGRGDGDGGGGDGDGGGGGGDGDGGGGDGEGGDLGGGGDAFSGGGNGGGSEGATSVWPALDAPGVAATPAAHVNAAAPNPLPCCRDASRKWMQVQSYFHFKL
jgi:hypothetical protein